MASVPPSDQMRVSGSGRRKVPLPPGRSQLGWIRNQARLPHVHPRTISLKELRTHCTREDAWTAIAGKVFNVTHYVEYHPGGVEMILAGAGKDATKLFNKYHSWVNPDFMLSRCYLGTLDPRDDESDGYDSDDESGAEEEDTAVSRPANTEDSKGAKIDAPHAQNTTDSDLDAEIDALRAVELEE